MKVQEVILKAMAGKMKWLEAAEVLGIGPRTMRRWKWKMEHQGMNALLDRRCGVPSPRRVPGTEVEGILQLYRERYAGFTVRHFCDLAVRDHGIGRSYTFVKHLLQGARLVRKHRARGKHRMRRERRACFGEMLHADGSRHVWLALVPGQYQSLITVPDDATSRLLYAQLWPSEGTRSVMTALRTVFLEHGLPQQLYTDRASWAAHTPKAGGKPDPRPTQLGRALEELGVEHLRAYSPQARGRSERLNRTRSRAGWCRNCAWPGSTRSRPPTGISSSASCPTSTRASPARRPTRRRDSSRSPTSISISTCACGASAGWGATTRSSWARRCSRAPNSPSAAAARGCASPCATTWTAASP